MATGPWSQVMQYVRRAAFREQSGEWTDGRVLQRFLADHDEAAFETLISRHGTMVWGVCQRILHHSQDAEDAFQATFLVLVRKANSLLERDNIGNWLYGVAYHTALKARAGAGLRRKKERQVRAVAAEDDAGLWEELKPLLDRELHRLPDKYREPVVLCDLEGKTRKEAAGILGCPEGSVSSRLSRGREILARRLSRHGLMIAGGALGTVLSLQVASAAPTSLVHSTVLAATGATGLVPAKVAALTEGVLKTMFVTKLKFASALVLAVAVLGAGVSGYLALAEAKQPTPKSEAAQPTAPQDKNDLAWIDKRVQEWQPTKEERRFDEIGWAKDIREAKRLAKEHERPVFLFTMKGHVAEGRC